ncbi:cell division protein SepF [Priestia endophytica]|jgi:cell division inhibitor SepF|uniref:Cell division protein SepF n=2 Tax=Priestia endophytica TaxID=135735 RepID=A0AAX1QB91_9BACI|nr:cell division protein SepF [Priestia endophytica]KAB2494767.1 cell division protein SepF [Priestia endophytica]KYG35836.1 cell division protein SepF [Priestia endophytica]MBG9814783.1 cell division protein SepF [Priestia endophytica]MCM3539356.1 cell division protein SepF [Priestia endophytica]RAS79432.1 cell division protein SepF [Priestia endophytica]
MGMKSKFKNFFALEEDEYVEEEYEQRRYEEEPREQEPREMKQQTQTQSQNQNVISLQSVQKSSKVVLFEPRMYAEAQDITDHLKNRKAVVVNLQRISRDQGVRIVDFLSGTVYALGGDIQKVGTNIFLCTPDNVDVTGAISDVGEEQVTNNKRW